MARPVASRKKVYAEKYRKGGLPIKAAYLPKCPHLKHVGFVVVEARILEAGRLASADGVEREYQVVELVLEENGT